MGLEDYQFMPGQKLIFSFILAIGVHLFVFIKWNSQKSSSPQYQVQLKFSKSSLAPSNPLYKAGEKNSTSPILNNSDPGVFQKAKPLSDISPEYPHLSRVYKEEGTVIIQVEIDQFGKVIEAKIIKSSGHTRLDQSGLSALNKSQFLPAQKNQISTASIEIIELKFQLSN